MDVDNISHIWVHIISAHLFLGVGRAARVVSIPTLRSNGQSERQARSNRKLLKLKTTNSKNIIQRFSFSSNELKPNLTAFR